VCDVGHLIRGLEGPLIDRHDRGVVSVPRQVHYADTDHFHISLRYLYLLFGDESTSVSRWIMERRLEHCRRQLVCSHRSFTITEVALRWGFNDPAHFSRAFKKRCGVSPRAYREGTDP
jgi:transcriptional regulator GlxA family with amidase domain